MTSEGQNLKPTLEWLRRNLALMDGACLDDPEDREAVAQHLYGNWVMVERGVTAELAAALQVVDDYEARGYFDRPPSATASVVRTALARYHEYNRQEVTK